MTVRKFAAFDETRVKARTAFMEELSLAPRYRLARVDSCSTAHTLIAPETLLKDDSRALQQPLPVDCNVRKPRRLQSATLFFFVPLRRCGAPINRLLRRRIVRAVGTCCTRPYRQGHLCQVRAARHCSFLDSVLELLTDDPELSGPVALGPGVLALVSGQNSSPLFLPGQCA